MKSFAKTLFSVEPFLPRKNFFMTCPALGCSFLLAISKSEFYFSKKNSISACKSQFV